MSRRTRRTTKQLECAPKGAVFLWCNADTEYPKRLARRIGREDINIQGKHVLGNCAEWFRGRRITGLVIDHAVQLTDDEYINLSIAKMSLCNKIRKGNSNET